MTSWIGIIGCSPKNSSPVGESKKKDMLTEKGQPYSTLIKITTNA
jgi:hypothetical protein